LYPIFRGLFNGLQIDKEKEPIENRPYYIDALTKNKIRQWSQPEEHIDDDVPEPNGEDIPEQTEEQPKVKVVNVLPVRGVVMKHDQLCGPVGTRTLGKRLLNADADENVIGHIMVVESGGGQSMASPELTDAMEKCVKPIVVWVDGMAASAAYHISCFAKEIIASRDLDLVGCIGTMIMWTGRKAKSEENSLGEIQVTIYADQATEKNEDYEKAINEFDFKFARNNFSTRSTKDSFLM
jgi:ClpP class serine protease